MNIRWESIVDALRAELAEYGGLLHYFEAQQQSLLARDSAAVLHLSTEIETQTRSAAERREQREQLVATFAREHQQPANATLRSLLPLIESAAQPLLEALIAEVNVLLHRVRRANRHNHALLARTVELHQELLQQLRPTAFTKTYSPDGRVSVAAPGASASLRVAG
jgi:flagellar biosynthesis/type III secretory pathway chaperone